MKTLSKFTFFAVIAVTLTASVLFLLDYNTYSLFFILKKYMNKSIQFKYLIAFNLLISTFIYSDILKKKINLLYITVLIFSLLFGSQFVFYIKSLNLDSFYTIYGTTTNEVFFFLKSLKYVFAIDRNNIFLIVNNLILFTFLSYFITFLYPKTIKVLSSNKRIYFIYFFVFGFFFNILLNLHSSLELSKNNKGDFQVPKFTREEMGENINELQVILYIGESTTIMNMGLYGYFRENTPNLSYLNKKNQIIKFNSVFSNHTHTGPSLIAALSFIESNIENKKIILQQKRVSVIDVLKKLNIDTKIFTYSKKEPIYNTLFKNAEIIENEKSVFGSGKLANHFDGNFYNHALKQDVINNNENKLYIFHSYAGHGPYKKNLPKKFQKKIDNFFEAKNQKTIFGKKIENIKNLEEYDMAISYIDNNLNEIIEDLNNSNFPKILIYFSDHGESVYTGRGHDSSRYIHEMSRIPFVVYFNISARKKYPDLYKKYSKKLNLKTPSTLSQFSSTVLDLFNIKISKSNFIVPKIIGMEEKSVHFPILNRDGVSISLKKNYTTSQKYNDFQNNLFVNHRDNKKTICYHRSNSIGKILRANLILNCIETDMVYSKKTEKFYISHSTKGYLNYIDLKDFLKIAKTKYIWLDLQEEYNITICKKLKKVLESKKDHIKKIFIELKINDYSVSDDLEMCSKDLLKFNNLEFMLNIQNLDSICKNNKSCYENKLSKMKIKLQNTHIGSSQSSYDNTYKELINNKYKFFTWLVDSENINSILESNNNIEFIAVNAFTDPNNF